MELKEKTKTGSIIGAIIGAISFVGVQINEGYHWKLEVDRQLLELERVSKIINEGKRFTWGDSVDMKRECTTRIEQLNELVMNHLDVHVNTHK